MAKKKVKKKTKKAKRSSRRSEMPEIGNVNYRIESAADTLIRANEINHQPRLLAKAKALLKQRQALINKTINGK